MNTTMTEPEIPLPVRRPDLVSWASGKSGQYLVRDRSSGETFQLGCEEQFLLEQLDGRQNAAQLCAAFTARFGQPLARDELAEFLDLAARRGFLEPDGDGRAAVLPGRQTRRLPGNSLQGGSAPTSRLLNEIVGGTLRVVAKFLQWLGKGLRIAGRKIYIFQLTRMNFTPRPDDIFIVTYPRSGTTWMQMILYQLTSDGSMEIPHIAEYCPWFESSLRSARGFETRPPPRIFKSHLPYRAIPKGPCKYIYVARDGRDVVVSNYHLYRTHVGYQGTFAEFFERFMRGKAEHGSWFQHVLGWWKHRHDPNVLFLTYEELTRDLEGCLRRIIDFCQFEVSSERLPGIVERCSFNFMKGHESKFDPAFELLWEEGVQLNSFLRKGRAGEGANDLTSEQAARFDAASRRHFEGTGLTRPEAQASTT